MSRVASIHTDNNGNVGGTDGLEEVTVLVTGYGVRVTFQSFQKLRDICILKYSGLSLVKLGRRPHSSRAFILSGNPSKKHLDSVKFRTEEDSNFNIIAFSYPVPRELIMVRRVFTPVSSTTDVSMSHVNPYHHTKHLSKSRISSRHRGNTDTSIRRLLRPTARHYPPHRHGSRPDALHARDDGIS